MEGHNPSMPEGPQIRAMFASVADRYDRANHLLSMGIDVYWRRAALAFAGLQAGEHVVDVCAGTGDLSLTLAKAKAKVVGSDFCPEMLVYAMRKRARLPEGSRPEFVAADAMKMPFPDNSFDLATVAFGIRNVADPVAGLREMARIVRPGGRVLVLEFSKPRIPLIGSLYLFYFRHILPRLGRLITGDQGGAYQYLPDSVMKFPERQKFNQLMEEAGLETPRHRLLTFGIASLYRAEVR